MSLGTKEAVEFLAKDCRTYVCVVTLRRDVARGRCESLGKTKGKHGAMELGFSEAQLKAYAKQRERGAIALRYIEYVEDGRYYRTVGWVNRNGDLLDIYHRPDQSEPFISIKLVDIVKRRSVVLRKRRIV